VPLKMMKYMDCDNVDISDTYVDIIISTLYIELLNTFKCHVFAPMGRLQLELIYLYFPPSFHQITIVSVLEAFRCYNNIINRSCRC